MNPDTFASFEDSEPDPHRLVIVTNNLQSKNAHGEMSHAWFTNLVFQADHGWSTFVGHTRIENLTHWKYP